MIREIPQKVEAQPSCNFMMLGQGSTLLRRTRSSVILGCLFAIGSIGVFAPQQKVMAASESLKTTVSLGELSNRTIAPKSGLLKSAQIKSPKIIAAQLKQAKISTSASRAALMQSGTVIHHVRSGETLPEIAAKYGVTIEALVASNQLKPSTNLKITDTLVIPSSLDETKHLNRQELVSKLNKSRADDLVASVDDGAEVNEPGKVAVSRISKDSKDSSDATAKKQPDDSIAENLDRELKSLRTGIAKTHSDEPMVIAAKPLKVDLDADQPIEKPGSDLIDIPIAAIGPLPKLPELQLPPLVSDNYLPSQWQTGGKIKHVWPAKGTFTSGYGWRWGRMHRGIDIAGPVGTPIVASAPGVVTYSRYNSGGYGNLVEVKHPDGSLTLYAHNRRNLVKSGQFVSQGQKISEMGSTGRSTGPHLHFELHQAGKGAVNPVHLLNRG